MGRGVREGHPPFPTRGWGCQTAQDTLKFKGKVLLYQQAQFREKKHRKCQHGPDYSYNVASHMGQALCVRLSLTLPGGGYLFFFFAVSCAIWDLSSLTRDQTYATCIGSTES